MPSAGRAPHNPATSLKQQILPAKVLRVMPRLRPVAVVAVAGGRWRWLQGGSVVRVVQRHCSTAVSVHGAGSSWLLAAGGG